jgi:hypothetical protein
MAGGNNRDRIDLVFFSFLIIKVSFLVLLHLEKISTKLSYKVASFLG